MHALTVGTVEISATTIALDGSTRTGTQEFTVTPVPPVVRPTITTAFNAPVATGVPNQVQISWAAVAGANGYTLYRTTDNLSNLVDSNPDNLAVTNQLTATITTNSNADVILSGTDKWYFLLTATTNGIESKTNGAQTVATAHPLTFEIVAGGGTDTFWMDRNLGASQKATSSTDADAYGGLYQWGRPADGHQARASGTRTALAQTISPNHAEFIAVTSGDWTASGVDTDGSARQALWSSINGSSICPTGFRVPTSSELDAERLSWTSNNRAGAFASNLKWTTTSYRANLNGVFLVNTEDHYWSSSVINGINIEYLVIDDAASYLDPTTFSRANGHSVRCIQN